MKITYTGTIVEVGNIGSAVSDDTGPGFSIDFGEQTITFEGLTGQQARDIGKHLFDKITITLQIGDD